MRDTQVILKLLFTSLFSAIVLSACGGSSGSSTSAILNNVNTNTNNPGTNNNTQSNDEGGVPAPIDLNVNSADTGSNSLMYVNGNNNARLTGPIFGTGELDNSQVVEKLSLYGYNGADTALSVIGVYAGYEERKGVKTNLVLAMQNNSEQLQCGQVIETNAVLKDGTLYSERAGGNPESYWIDADGSNYNSIDINGYPSIENDCVPPGSIVYGNIDLAKPFSDEGVDFGLAAGITGGVSFAAPYPANREVSAPIVPLSYTVDEAGDAQVLIENQDGSQAYEVSIEAYVLSAEGWPMASINGLGELVLQPGESGELPLRGSQFRGSASALRVLVEADYCGLDAGYAPDC